MLVKAAQSARTRLLNGPIFIIFLRHSLRASHLFTAVALLPRLKLSLLSILTLTDLIACAAGALRASGTCVEMQAVDMTRRDDVLLVPVDIVLTPLLLLLAERCATRPLVG